MEIFIIFQIIVLILSVVVHEVSHGYAADELGDPTAREMGRLTLNPLKHLDPFGSVILPLLLSLVPGGVVFGWAKPVPFNPFRLKNPKRDSALIAFAGPASNLVIAIAFSIFYRIIAYIPDTQGSLVSLELFFASIIVINIVLAVFNSVPIPPLDGSKILFAFIPAKYERFFEPLERYGMFILLLFIFFGLELISPVIYLFYRFLIGV